MPPLVSCLMPTYGRRHYVPQAIAYFLRQDYANCELIVIDDGEDPVGDLMPKDDARIRYERLPRRVSLGEKRNLACERARGDFLLHWDDDDWHGHTRVRTQVEALVASGAEFCGLAKLWFFDPRKRQAWEYLYGNPRRPWVAGGSLCYRRSFWQRNRFPHISVGEDSRFVWALPSVRPHVLRDNSFYAALIHSSNTCAKRVADSRYQPRPYATLAERMGSDLEFYEPNTPPSPKHPPMSEPTPATALPALTTDSPSFSLCYTSRRAGSIAKVIQLWLERAAAAEVVEVVIAVDGDDAASQAAATAIPRAQLVVQTEAPFNCVRGWNAAAAQARGRVLLAISDDVEPPARWDETLLALEPSGWSERETVVITHDGLHGTEGHVAIVTRTRYEHLGYLFYPTYESMYCDTDLAAHARYDGVALDAKARVRFQHHHVDNRHRSRDQVDLVHASAERYRAGAAIFKERQQTAFASKFKPSPLSSEHMSSLDDYAAYLQAIHDDFCLSEVLLRLHEEGVRNFFLSIPSEHWSGKPTAPEEIAQVRAAADKLRTETQARVEVMVGNVAQHRRPGLARARVETFVRNEALAWVAHHGFRHCLVVDDDELWRRGLLGRLDALVRTRRPATVTCQMIPVAGVPGFPIAENKDLVTIYMDLQQCQFRECRSPDKATQTLAWPGVIHFTAVKRTREELISKMRDSGHYDDPKYEFEDWIQNKLPHLRPGFRNVHMYRPMQIWPLMREWSSEEIADLPESLYPYLGVKRELAETR